MAWRLQAKILYLKTKRLHDLNTTDTKSMKRTTCKQLLQMETISSAFKSKQAGLSDQIISCFYSCYQSLFIQWAKITYKRYPADMVEFVAGNSFTDGVLKLKESASRDELYKGNASVKTVLFHYCRNILLGYLTNERRLSEKNKKLATVFSNAAGNDTGETEQHVNERRHKCLMQALAKMTVADRQIIQWRHDEEKSNDEIAALLAIKAESATNRIYRCMKRLRKLIDEMERKGET